eukprot:TRINITY_DN2197_c0_g1_i1.p1 TRINITY_DN2197_c0_g1~~TRINITY_DN2197_c0_g1_i1.p1  ORF type:complete len:333 (-),score=107.93 TRINITY_DN2197_c0_g1_i1:7-903(-)
MKETTKEIQPKMNKKKAARSDDLIGFYKDVEKEKEKEREKEKEKEREKERDKEKEKEREREKEKEKEREREREKERDIRDREKDDVSQQLKPSSVRKSKPNDINYNRGQYNPRPKINGPTMSWQQVRSNKEISPSWLNDDKQISEEIKRGLTSSSPTSSRMTPQDARNTFQREKSASFSGISGMNPADDIHISQDSKNNSNNRKLQVGVIGQGKSLKSTSQPLNPPNNGVWSRNPPNTNNLFQYEQSSFFSTPFVLHPNPEPSSLFNTTSFSSPFAFNSTLFDPPRFQEPDDLENSQL